LIKFKDFKLFLVHQLEWPDLLRQKHHPKSFVHLNIEIDQE